MTIWNDSSEWHMLLCLLPSPKKEGSRVENVSINVNTAMQIKKNFLSKEVSFRDVGHFCI